MAGDITARIMIAVEYANIDQQCEEIAAALGKVTQARQEDLSTAQKATAQTNENATAINKETAAIEKNNEARKKPQTVSRFFLQCYFFVC